MDYYDINSSFLRVFTCQKVSSYMKKDEVNVIKKYVLRPSEVKAGRVESASLISYASKSEMPKFKFQCIYKVAALSLSLPIFYPLLGINLLLHRSHHRRIKCRLSLL